MNNGKSRKELQRQYQEREIIGGVYIIKNTKNNKILLKSDTNLQGIRNRFEFSQKTNSCVEVKLQDDWKRYGAEQFVFEVLEELKKGETQTAQEFEADLDAIKEIWLDNLSGRDFY